MKMEAHQYEGKTLSYITVYPDDYKENTNYPMVILLHGYGADMSDLAGLVPAMHRTGYIYVIPNAPVQIQIAPGITGYGWGAIGDHATPQEIEYVNELLLGFFDEVSQRYDVPPGRIALGGFSQGGGVSIRIGLTRPEIFAGIFILSSGVRSIEEIRNTLPENRTQPIFFAYGTQDPFLVDGLAEKSIALLQSEGYTIDSHEYDMAHEITPKVILDLNAWIAKVLPPFSS